MLRWRIGIDSPPDDESNPVAPGTRTNLSGPLELGADVAQHLVKMLIERCGIQSLAKFFL